MNSTGTFCFRLGSSFGCISGGATATEAGTATIEFAFAIVDIVLGAFARWYRNAAAPITIR